MRKVKVVLSGWSLGMLLAAPAFADIPPPDACMQAEEGKACDNAGEAADKPGLCKKDSCTKQTPSGSMTYECYVCQETTGAGGSTTGNGGTNAETSTKDDEEGGCSLSPGPARGLAAVFAPVAALALAAARRRRSRR